VIVCQCRRVSDREVRAAVARGAESIDEIASACGAGAECRGCESNLAALLAESRGLPAPGDRRRLLVVAAA
jgi:bacterioferritin-associated ferredoxin